MFRGRVFKHPKRDRRKQWIEAMTLRIKDHPCYYCPMKLRKVLDDCGMTPVHIVTVIYRSKNSVNVDCISKEDCGNWGGANRGILLGDRNQSQGSEMVIKIGSYYTYQRGGLRVPMKVVRYTENGYMCIYHRSARKSMEREYSRCACACKEECIKKCVFCVADKEYFVRELDKKLGKLLVES